MSHDSQEARMAKSVVDHDKITREEIEKEVEYRRTEIARIEKSYCQQTIDEKKKSEETIRNAIDDAMESIQKAGARLEERRKENQQELSQFDKESSLFNKQELSELKQKCSKEADRREARVKEDRKVIEANCEWITEERKLERKIDEKNRNEKSTIAKEMEEKNRIENENHQQKLSNLLEHGAETERKHQEDLLNLSKTQRAENLKGIQKHQNLEETIMMGGYASNSAAADDRKQNEFRAQCRPISHSFTEAKSRFEKEESLIMITINLMKSGKKLKSQPNIEAITSSLRKFSNQIQKLTAPTENFRELQIEMQNTSSELITELNLMCSEIANYEPAGNESIMVASLVKMRELMGKLSKLVLSFNIPPATNLQEALKRQVPAILDNSSHGLFNQLLGAVTNGPVSTGSIETHIGGIEDFLDPEIQ